MSLPDRRTSSSESAAETCSVILDAMIAAIDKAIALLKPGDKRIETCQSMRETFRGSLRSKLGLEKFLGR